MNSTPNTNNTPGAGYSVGSKCLVNCPQDAYAEVRVATARLIDPSYERSAPLNTILYGDNGRIVQLLGVVTGNCPICGGSTEWDPSDPISWHVKPVDGYGPLKSYAGIHDNSTGCFYQYQLIPLGNEDLTVEIAAESTSGDFTDLHVANGETEELPTTEQKGVDK
jgi:hypothetical protein